MKEMKCKNLRIVKYLFENGATLLRKEKSGNRTVFVFSGDDRCMDAIREFQDRTKIAFY